MKPEMVTPIDRERTKRVVYAVVYGVGENSTLFMIALCRLWSWFIIGKERLAEILHISVDAAKNLMSSFLGTCA